MVLIVGRGVVVVGGANVGGVVVFLMGGGPHINSETEKVVDWNATRFLNVLLSGPHTNGISIPAMPLSVAQLRHFSSFVRWYVAQLQID